MKRLLLAIVIVFLGCEAPTNSTKSDSLSNPIDTNTGSTSSVVPNEQKPFFTALKAISIDKSNFLKIKSSLRVKGDEFSDSKFYSDKSSPQFVNRNGVFCYIGLKDQKPDLRFTIQYTADEWLFIRRMTFNVDGKNYDYGPLQFKTDNGSGAIWEWSDESVDVETMPLLVALATGQKAKVKYIGQQYYKIVAIKSSQQAAIKRILQIYKGFLLGYQK